MLLGIKRNEKDLDGNQVDTNPNRDMFNTSKNEKIDNFNAAAGDEHQFGKKWD